MYTVWLKGEKRERCWYIGMPVPLEADELHLVTMLQADGDELWKIERLTGLTALTDVERWHDKKAQWILAILTAGARRKATQIGPYTIYTKEQ